MANRRSFLQSAISLGAALVAPGRAAEAASSRLSSSRPRTGTTRALRTITPDVGDLPFEMDGGVKVFRLTAHVLRQQVAPNKSIDVWGFNGSAPGPTIQVTEGDDIRVHFTNHLPEPSSLHWHGFEDEIGFDGMPGISQEPVKPGDTFTYEFHIKQRGTFFYHSHMAMQELAGMLGAVIMHPREAYQPHCDKDFVIHLQEYSVLPNNTIPNTMNMEFNWLLLNGKAGPATTPLIVREGERVRIRFINLGMDHHPMHLHGHTFVTTGTEGGRIQESAWWPGNTVLVGVAQARDVEFVANNVGDWMVHCHLPHHMMNQMASQAGPMTRDAGMGLPKAGAGMNMGAGSTNMDAGSTNMDAGSMSMDAHAGMTMQGMPMPHPPAGAPASQSLEFPLGDKLTMNASSALADTRLDPSMMGMMSEMQSGAPAMSALQKRHLDAFDMSAGSMKQQQVESAPNANNVPNFPQDFYMEGPMMTMDALVERPENYGLRPGWSRFMQGMMTFVRVLPAAKYDEVLARMQAAKRPADPYASLWSAPTPETRG